MALGVIRALAEPRLRAFRRTLMSVLGMAAIVLGLLAMHSAGAEHANVVEVPVAASHSHSGGEPDEALAAAGIVPVIAATTVLHCDDACLHGVMDCALMVMACAMLLAVVVLVLLAARPGEYRKLMDAGGRVVAALPRVPLHVLRPDLTVLSISRT